MNEGHTDRRKYKKIKHIKKMFNVTCKRNAN